MRHKVVYVAIQSLQGQIRFKAYSFLWESLSEDFIIGTFICQVCSLGVSSKYQSFSTVYFLLFFLKFCYGDKFRQ